MMVVFGCVFIIDCHDKNEQKGSDEVHTGDRGQMLKPASPAAAGEGEVLLPLFLLCTYY
jgi:hypothetical protein